MPHGQGLLGDPSTTQAAIIIPKPGSQTRYYIFTADDAGGPNGLTYSEVDMLADNGKGDVISVNNSLITPVSEKITAVNHANGKDIWITAHQWGGNAFYSYIVTATGVSTSPVTSNTGLVIEGSGNSGHYAGWMAISPNGKKLASASGLLAIELFDFDTATGKVSNGTTLKSPAKAYGVEFSPNSKLLYATSDGAVLQYEVNAPNVAATQTEVGTVDVASSIKLGPDSKIYVVSKYLSNKLSVISAPNVVGTKCNFSANTVDLGGKQTFVGLPNFLVTPYYLIDIDTKTDCTDTSVSFAAQGTLETETVTWDFGDGNSSNSKTVTHTYAEAGTYNVKAKAKSLNTTRFFSKQVTIVSAPVAVKPLDLTACGSPEGTNTFNLIMQDKTILGTQPGDLFTVSYYTSQADADADTNALPYLFTNTVNPQTIYARLSRNNASCYDTTSFTLSVASSPVLEMEDHYSFCESSYVVLTAPEGFDSYTWTFNGKTETGDYQKSVRKAGVYTLTVTKATGEIICDASKTIVVEESKKPVIRAIEVEDWTDSNNSINIVTASNGNYEYSIDGDNYQDSPLFENLTPGEYTINVRDKSGCGQAEGDAIILMYPKFFTPNGDGVHDKWQVKHSWYAPDVAVTIFDRYGKTLASFKGNSSGWDGTFNGNQLPANDYWFVVTRSNGREYKGHFSMMR